MNVKIKPISNKFKLLYRKSRYKILYGGRGSGKSYAVTEALIYYACNFSVRILCCREIQKSIKESSYKMIVDMINQLGLSNLFYITNNSIINKETESEFIFMGLRSNVTSIQSIANIDICWIEESQSISEDSWRVLTPSIRATGSEIWATLNPYLPTDIICKNFIEITNPDALVQKINYVDNPKCPKVLLDEAEYMKENNPEMYKHVWLGEYMQQGSNHLFRLGSLLEAQKRPGIIKDAAPIIAGLDVARFGNDSSALVIRQHGRIIYHKKYHKLELFTLCKQVMETLINFKVDQVIVDANGIGVGAYEKLKEINTAIKFINYRV